MRKCFLVFGLLFIANFWLYGQASNKLSSYEGLNFYAAFMQNEVVYPGETPPANTLDLLVSSSRNANIEVRFRNTVSKYSISANSIQRISFDRSAVLSQSESITSQGINITSDVPITVYGINSIKLSSDMFSVIPVQNWGTEYYVMSYPNDIYRGYTDMAPAKANIPRKSQFCIVASYDNTTVHITPKVQTSSGKPANVEYSVTLDAGETYLVQSSDVVIGGDLSGSRVRSDKPVGCLSGHVRTGVFQTFGFPWASKDHLVEMLTPVSSWGKSFITTPFVFSNQRNGNLFRLTSATANTTVFVKSVTGVSSAYNIPNPGDIIEIDNLHEAASWQSTSPIQIMQLMRHTGDGNDTPTYDPSMSGVPPLEQFVPKIIFQVPTNTASNPRQFISHTAMLVIETSALDNIRLDGIRLVDMEGLAITKIPDLEYYWVRIPILPGSHTFVADNGRFSGVLYGNGDEDSYSLVLGTSLLPPNMNDKVAPVLIADSTCGHIRGSVSEISDGADNSGLNFIYVDKKTTVNYSYNIGNLTDTSTIYYFDAEIIDKNDEAHIDIIGRDRANNEFSFTHHYYPLKAEYSSKVLTPASIDWQSKPCYDYWVQNNSKIPYQLKSITSDNPKIKITIDKTLPYTLAVGEKINYTICLDPNNQYGDIAGNVTLLYECDKLQVIPVNAKVVAVNIEAEGIDFGRVYVDKDSCSYINIRNIGKDDITIRGITIEQNSGQFEYYTQSIFPLIIKSGQTDSIKVCFLSRNKGSFIDIVAIKYNTDQTERVQVKGEGINPELIDLQHSFGNKRLGTLSEHEFTIANTGNVEAKVKYYATETESSEFNIDEFKSINITIKPNYDYKFKVYYNPQNTGTHTIKATYIIDDDVNKIYTLELDGSGTIPTIETNDINLGDTKIFSKINKNIDIVKSGGNEQLNVKSIKIVGGNIASFDLVLSQSQNKTMQPGDVINLPIEFRPQFVGLHEIKVEVISDAAFNNEFVADTFRIYAGARAIDTTAFKLKLNAPNQVIACNDFDIEPVITNSGNVDITVTELLVNDPSIAAGRWAIALDNPVVLAPGEVRKFLYTITPAAHESGKLVFTAIGDGGAQMITAEYSFATITEELKLITPASKDYLPGDIVNFTFAGKFLHKVSTPINSNLRIETDKLALRLINDNYKLKIYNNSDFEEISLDLEQKNNYIDIPIIGNKILINDDVNWQIDLSFRAYLTVDTFRVIRLEYQSDKCFDAVRDSIVLMQTPFCVNDIRPVEFVPNPIINSRYDEMSSSLDIEIKSYTDDKANFEIFNSLGESVKFMRSIDLKKGTHKLSIDLSELSSGVYVLNINGIRLSNNKIFIKK